MRFLPILAAALILSAPALAGARCPGCSVVLIGIDDLRADRFASSRLLPRVRIFSRTAVAFEDAVSQAPWTLPSFMTIFTGQHPSRHRVVNKYADASVEPPVQAKLKRLSPGVRTLAEVLRAAGLRTAAFTGGAGLTGSAGFSDGFEVYDDSAAFAGFDRSAPKALAWLGSLKPGERFFLFVHGYDVHALHPGHWPASFEERYLGLRERQLAGPPTAAAPAAGQADRRAVAQAYDRSLAALDANLGPLLDRLDASDLRSRTIVVLVSDHGEELFEHGGLDHGLTLFEELIRVALAVRVPGTAPKNVRGSVRLVDLMPTVLDMAGIEVDPGLAAQFDGVSLTPALEGGTLSLDALSETDFLLRSSLRALRTGDGWKVVEDLGAGKASLYRLADDPGERRDLGAEEPRRLQELEARVLTAFDPEPLEPGGRAVARGRWKFVDEGGRGRLYDLYLDPMQRSDLSAARPELARELSELLRGAPAR